MADPNVPPYMAQLLDELGWNQGTRIPLANPENQGLENLLIKRHNEIQHLKEALILQKQKQDDLNKYKGHVHSEYQENTRLLFAHKQQMEQEVKLKQISCNETERLDRDVTDCTKQSKDISSRVDRLQGNIARLLKKADELKGSVCGERGALQEWRAALERVAGDITAIEQFTKQDLSKAKALETKRQKLKTEHDRVAERLAQIVGNLNAEERACERIALQVEEGMEQRKQMMAMWTSAVENLRQRDTDIRHIREDYIVLENEAGAVAEQCREQQAFCEQQRGDNAEAARDNTALAQRLGHTRVRTLALTEQNVTLDSEAQSLQREMANMRNQLERLHMENRQLMDDQHKKDTQLRNVKDKLNELKLKVVESMDKSKSAEKRAKQLEDMLNEEERYASQVTTSQQRVMHCSFVEQQKLLALKNEEKLFHMNLKASKAIMDKLDSKQQDVERGLQTQKESLYGICYQVETVGARVSHMEGSAAERACSGSLAAREARLRDVRARHAARAALLERHAARLADDMRALTRDLDATHGRHKALQSRLRTAILNVEGGEKELKASREEWRRGRVDEALLRLRVAHSTRAVAGLDDKAFTIDKQRLQLDAAMNERLVEIAARRDMFAVQRRALFEDCGRLRCEIKERDGRIEQLKKRYDILIASLGKDESGQQLSVTFFKIKFAAERAELRERGAALDGAVGRAARDVAALEATLRLMHAAHAHFLHHVQPLATDTPEMEEVHALSQQYYTLRDELKQTSSRVSELDETVTALAQRATLLADKHKQLEARESEAECDLQSGRERVSHHEGQLKNARCVVRRNAARAKKLIEGVDDWRVFQLAVWVRDYAESGYNGLRALWDMCSNIPDANYRLAALVSSTDLQRCVPDTHKRLMTFVQRIVAESSNFSRVESASEECVMSTSPEASSRSSLHSGHGARLTSFRQRLAKSLHEPKLVRERVNKGRAEKDMKTAVAIKLLSLDCISADYLPGSGK